MSFLDKIEQNVKIKPFLQFVGYMLAYGGLIFACTQTCHWTHPLEAAFGVAYVGVSVSMAGWLYDVIYP